jgi:hypothetical protein
METGNMGAPFPLKTNQPSVVKISRATWVGLFLSLFAMVVIRHAFVFFVPEITFASAILKEALIWASAAALLLLSVAANGCRLDRSALAHAAGGNRLLGDW